MVTFLAAIALTSTLHPNHPNMPQPNLKSENSNLRPATTSPTSRGQSRKPGRMDWWREARFGMFIHWGLYSVLAGEWNGSKGHAEWIRETAHIPINEYEKLLGQFNPVKFDADAWAKMAKDAGMKYLVITSKHHDGFNLFDSPYTDWDVMNTPFKRDIMKELSAACKRQGIVFCMYHSIMDWHHPDYLPKRSWEGETWRNSTIEKIPTGFKPDFDRFNKYLQNEVRHIIQAYDPGVLWFDGEWESTWNHGYGQPLYDLCLAAKPSIIVNNRVDVSRGGMEGMSQDNKSAGDFGTPEQTIPATGMPGVDWETCMTMNGNWGYNAADKNFKSTKSMVQMLVDIASKGGNYLMNIGPKADGTFPDESIQRLKEIGVWMRQNGESIYGSSASPFKKLPWGRATTKKLGNNTRIYLHVFDWPSGGKLVVPGLGNFPLGAEAVGMKGKAAALKVERVGSDLVIGLPAKPTNDIDTVVALTVRGAPIVYEAPEILADAGEFVSSIKVTLKAGEGQAVVYTTDGSEPLPANKSNRTYKSDLVLSETTRIRARTFHNGKPVSGVVERRFEKVKPWPAKNTGVVAPKAGVEVMFLEGSMDKLPPIPAGVGGQLKVMPNFSIADDPKKENCARFFMGWINVPADDMYLFGVTSDDGSKLWIDGKVVVDNDGLHSSFAKSGAVPLAAGHHQIVVGWFNKTGGAELSVGVARLGEKLKPIPDGWLKH
ncbi:MAG: alpha-L-fucosidase [Armatimonadetes bacterium]|nr:alpha-L-fucosidase [Armatimonadota bacterium]